MSGTPTSRVGGENGVLGTRAASADRGARPKSLDRARALVEPVLVAASATLAPELRRVAEYHFGWCDEHGAPVARRPGKALRPALAVLSAEAVAGEAAPGLAGAAAVELVHDFTLLHDDVMDEDRERRGRPAAWTRFGVARAICAGDALMLLAQQVIEADSSPHRFAALAELGRAARTVIAGQSLDLAFETRTDVSPGDYLEMAAQKTGALLGCAASIGALLAGGETPAVDALRAFGTSLGLAFQAVDDWLGIWGDPARTGKPAASDLRQRKCSLPIVLALGESGPVRERLRDWLGSERSADAPELGAAIGWLGALGAEERTLAFARRQLTHALARLDEAALPPASRDAFAELACFTVEREL